MLNNREQVISQSKKDYRFQSGIFEVYLTYNSFRYLIKYDFHLTNTNSVISRVLHARKSDLVAFLTLVRLFTGARERNTVEEPVQSMASLGVMSSTMVPGSSAASMASKRWYFPEENLKNTPSVRTGQITLEKELSYRQQAANFIQDMGQRLEV